MIDAKKRLARLGSPWWLIPALVGCGGAASLTTDGGYVLTYQLESEQAVNPTAMADAIQSRLVRAGFPQATARSTAENTFEVQLPGADAQATATAKKVIRSTGLMEFRILAHRKLHADAIARALSALDAQPNVEESFWRRFNSHELTPDESMVTRVNAKQEQEILVMNDEWDLNATFLKSATAGYDSTFRPCLLGQFKGEGALLMGRLTTAHEYDSQFRLAIIFDDAVISAPMVVGQVTDQFQLTGNFTQDEIDEMIAILNSGTFPARLDPAPVSERRVEPQ